jgi:hypothetical protein
MTSSTALAFAAILVIVPHLARAGDTCFRLNQTVTLVGKNFKIPGRGKCKPLAGFLQEDNTFWFGGACASSDGTTAHIDAHGTSTDYGIEHIRFDLNLSTLTGTGKDCVADTGVGGTCVVISKAEVVPCSPVRVPIP